MDRKEEFRYRAWLDRPPIETLIPPKPARPPEWPAWAVHALARGDDVPGRLQPLWARWYQTCPVCKKTCFLVHPYLMPAFEEVNEDGHWDGIDFAGHYAKAVPLNPVRAHPCRFFDTDAEWEITK